MPESKTVIFGIWMRETGRNTCGASAARAQEIHPLASTAEGPSIHENSLITNKNKEQWRRESCEEAYPPPTGAMSVRTIGLNILLKEGRMRTLTMQCRRLVFVQIYTPEKSRIRN